jgi:hypothetical protein
MPLQEDINIENANSLSRQRSTRKRRDVAREMKDKLNDALRNAYSTKERREIKSKFKVDTNKARNQTDNQTGVNEDSNQRGDDNFKPSYNNVENGGGGGLPDGSNINDTIYWDGTDWIVFDAPSSTGTFVLGVNNGTMTWVTPPSSPFQIVQIDSDTIAIRKGTVSTIVPTIGGTPLNDDYTLNTINVSGATTFWLNATVNASEVVTAVSIVTSDPGADTATRTKQVLGSLTWDSGAIDVISSNLGGSQNVDSCGASHSWNRI